jgi:hypothetical protein
MLHGNPRLVDFMLKRENVARQTIPGNHRQIEYFIPFCFLGRVQKSSSERFAERIAEANSLRDDFHDFVFIHTTDHELASLLRQDWNRDLSNRLRFFRDIHRRKVVISDKEMNTLIRVFGERRLRFSIGLPVPELSPDMNVCITAEGAFNGQMARVIAVKHMPDGISLTLGIQVFQGARELKLPDFKLSAIQMEKDPSDIIGWEFLRASEDTLVDILSRRLNHKETDETRQADLDMLNRLFLYSYITIADTTVAAQFLALMLICSTLRFDRESTQNLISQAQQLLHGSTPLPPHIQAYLYLSLYIATRDASLRTKAKHALHSLPSPQASQSPQAPRPSTALSRLLSLSRRLHSKRKRELSDESL